MLTVFGAIHTDISIVLDAMPGEGETVPGHQHAMTPGGRGANQALAAARADAKVAFVGMIGDDDMGKRATRVLRQAGVRTSGVGVSDRSVTGLALRMRTGKQDDHRIISPGANDFAAADQVPAEILKSGDYVLLQMDLPLEQNLALLEKAKDNGATTVLNLSPTADISPAVLACTDYLIVNAHEAGPLRKQLDMAETEDDVARMARAISRKGDLACIITRDLEGAIGAQPRGDVWHINALTLPDEEIIDTTASGDVYCGTFTACMQNGMGFVSALKYASVAASLTCMYSGVQDSFPYWGDIEKACGDVADPEHINSFGH